MTHDEEQWDDLAILKAFDAALNKQKAEAASAPPAKTKKKAAPAKVSVQQQYTPVHANPATPSPTTNEYRPSTPHIPQQAAAYQPPPSPSMAYPHEAIPPQLHFGYAHAHLDGGHSPYQAPSPFTQTPPQSSHATSTTYADAYARAYAHAMTHGHGSYIPPLQPPSSAFQHPRVRHVPQGHAFSVGVGPGVSLPAIDGDDDLSKLLLSWYQSGYYAGRYKAIQEMKQQTYHR
ncbi:hypothetical protein H310_12091 [Aphanomyces invadans]|uniref:Survival motor neuron Tudor domain-containing protein n=1 Tax=Aphanomyces invadans TaxID=157072 RepID=A0A024TJ96_9STRA|nr:hypothetical protein H310_12091 [Aphanomyces invadans]ETV94059.1 hypothetical protein H310_12091 [Aphanomyces invadans]|eukprot:XP_008877262.1 hypothetical protein H310_12091 [Aphanomyces invadans]